MRNWREEVKKFLEEGREFKVRFEDDVVKVEEVKGVGRVKVDLKGLRKYAGRRSLSEEQRDLLMRLAEKIVEVKRPFRISIGSKEFILRFDLDHYVRVHSKGCSIVGFRNEFEEPLSFVINELKSYGPIKLLSPVRG